MDAACWDLVDVIMPMMHKPASNFTAHSAAATAVELLSCNTMKFEPQRADFWRGIVETATTERQQLVQQMLPGQIRGLT